MKTEQKVFKIASFLLHYPTRAWINELDTVVAEVDMLNDQQIKTHYHSFIQYVRTTPFNQLCEKYVYTFDYHGIVTLHLTYHVFKDSRQRGEALVKLREIFSQSNLETMTDELPDYLPLILEFLSVATDKQARQLLKMHDKSIVKLHDDLVKENSSYHFILKAINEISLQKFKNKDVS